MFAIEYRLRGLDQNGDEYIWTPAIDVSITEQQVDRALTALRELYGPDYDLRATEEFR